MAHLQHFAYGWVTPVVAYLFSYLGCFLGLKATGRALIETSPGVKARWLALAAWAIGGTGIWVMHFLAMTGFEVAGSAVRYDLSITIASWIIAVVVVGIGLFVVGYGRRSAIKIVAAGVFTGLGVAAMHYTGMAAMKVDGHKHYSMPIVDASVVIAVVAAIVALWFTVTLQRNIAVVAAAAVMAIAVTGMHYTGMAAIRIRLNATPTTIDTGITTANMLVPIFLFTLLVLIALGYGMLNSVSARDKRELEELQNRLRGGLNVTGSAGQAGRAVGGEATAPAPRRTTSFDFTRRR